MPSFTLMACHPILWIFSKAPLAALSAKRMAQSEDIVDVSRKGAKGAKFGENRKLLFFAVLASWREKLSVSICVNRRKSAVKYPVIVPNGDMFLFVVVSRQTKS